jgi:hypothetical protein
MSFPHPDGEAGPSEGGHKKPRGTPSKEEGEDDEDRAPVVTRCGRTVPVNMPYSPERKKAHAPEGQDDMEEEDEVRDRCSHAYLNVAMTPYDGSTAVRHYVGVLQRSRE